MTDLGLNIVAGSSEVAGLYRFKTGQRILSDNRQSLVNFHNAHDDHIWSGFNQTGESSSWPAIVPFNDGFIAMHQIYVYGPEDPDFSPLSNIIYRFTAIDADGDFLWTRDYDYSDFSLRQTDVPSDFSTIGSYVDMWLVAGNDNSRTLMRKYGQSDLGNTDDYVWLDWDVDGDYVETPAFSLNNSTNYSLTWMYNTQVRCGSGYLVAGNADIDSSGIRLYCFDGDLDLVDSLVTPTQPGTFSRHIVRQWNGVLKPHLVEFPSAATPADWRAYEITFDGVTSASVGSPFTGSFAENLYNNDYFFGSTGLKPVNWTTGAGVKPADNWLPSDGSVPVVAPNPNNMEWVYAEDYTGVTAKNLSLQFSIMADWYDVTPQTDPYNGDRFGYLPSPVRFNFFNALTKTAAAVDIEPHLPTDITSFDYDPASLPFNTLYDWDMDDAGYAVSHPDSGLIFAYTYNYWAFNGPSGVGPDYGRNNTLTSYWIVEALDGSPAPTTTMPSWWNAFGGSGSSGGGVAPASSADCARLGQGENVVFLYDRGGTRPIAQFPKADLSTVRWSRKRDDISNATIILNSPGSDCCQIINEMEVGRHELVVFRNGIRSWEGPITRANFKANSVEVEAHDICHYISRTIMRSAYDNRYRKKGSRVGPVTKRAQAVLQTELARKERLGYNILKFLDVRTHPKTTRTSRYTPQYYSTAWEELDYLAAKLSLDYTVIGRRLVINDVHDVIGRLQMLTDKDFSDELVVSYYGMELATRSAVTDGQGHWAAVGGIDDYYGEVELLNTTYGEEAAPASGLTPTKEELAALAKEMTSQAQRNMSGRYPIPAMVRVPDNTQLSPEAPVDINELIPGVRVPIRATLACKQMEQEQKLDSMQVEQSGNAEKVTITLSPAPGSTPWDDSSESGPGDEED